MQKVKKFGLHTTLAVIVVIIAIHFVSAFTIDRRLQYKEICYGSPKVRSELHGYTIAFVTDAHSMSKSKMRQMVQKINDRKVDLLLLGGDMGKHGLLWQTMPVLAQTQTKDGIYGVDGNHDNFWELFAAMRANGIKPLDNEGLSLRPGLYLAGVQDDWVRTPDTAAALAGAPADDFVLLLSHNPDVAMKQDISRADLMLAGHTHGGQITYLGKWAPALNICRLFTPYGQKFMKGWAKGLHNTDVFISSGVGQKTFSPRIFAPPQVIYLTLKSTFMEKA